MRNALVHLRPLASPRLTLLLLLLLATLSALGTAVPQGLDPASYQERYGEQAQWVAGLRLSQYYASPWYRCLLAALFVNLLACGLGRSWTNLKSMLRGGVGRGRLRAVGFPLVHLCPVLVAAGALWGSWGGFTGTTYGVLQAPAWSFFNWTAREDQALPFVLVVEEIRRLHYPLRLRVGLGESEEGGRLVETQEGARFDAEPFPYQVELGSLDVSAKDLTFYLIGADGRSGPFSSAAGDAPIPVVPVAYRDPQLRRVEADISVRDGENRELQRHTLAVNDPLVVGRLRLFLTAWSPDAQEPQWVGLQIVRDPGQAVMWTGAIGLSTGVVLMLLGRGRRRQI